MFDNLYVDVELCLTLCVDVVFASIYTFMFVLLSVHPSSEIVSDSISLLILVAK